MKSRLGMLSLAVFAFTSASVASPSEQNQADHFTRKELKSLAATASTPEDHRKLAVYYEQALQRETAEAQKAEQELQAEQANPVHRSAKQPNGRLNYFQYQVEHHRAAAEKAQALAALHRERSGMAPSAAVPSVAQSSKSTENCCSMSCRGRSGSC
jgi:hypothetical protein